MFTVKSVRFTSKQITDKCSELSKWMKLYKCSIIAGLKGFIKENLSKRTEIDYHQYCQLSSNDIVSMSRGNCFNLKEEEI